MSKGWAPGCAATRDAPPPRRPGLPHTIRLPTAWCGRWRRKARKPRPCRRHGDAYLWNTTLNGEPQPVVRLWPNQQDEIAAAAKCGDHAPCGSHGDTVRGGKAPDYRSDADASGPGLRRLKMRAIW